jgi:hypothetical protein
MATLADPDTMREPHSCQLDGTLGLNFIFLNVADFTGNLVG